MFEKITVKWILLSILFCIILLMTIVAFKVQRNVDVDVIHMIQEFNWHKGDAESKYKKMMIRILTAYSYRYDPYYRKSMKKEQKIDYIRFNWKASRLIRISPFIVPQINKQESSFNPNLDHEYGETGLGGMKFATAMLAHKIVELMPSNLRSFFYFNLKTKRDLKDPIINNKCTYILLWYNMRCYDREDWAILVYRWGGFYSRHYKGGYGEPPRSFTLNGIKYNTYKYYFELASYVEAYESGKLEPNKPIKERWDKYYSKLVKEEIDYRNCVRIIRNQRNLLKDRAEIIEMLKEKDVEIQKAVKKMEDDLLKIAPEAKSIGWRKRTYNKLKKSIKDFFKRNKK